MDSHYTGVKSVVFNGNTPLIATIEAEVYENGRYLGISGIEDFAGRPALERVLPALEFCRLDIPENAGVRVRIVPVEVLKTGEHYDLGIAIAIVAAVRRLSHKNLRDCQKDGNDVGGGWVILGKLDENGFVHEVPGVSFALRAAYNAWEKRSVNGVIIPMENAMEAAQFPHTDMPIYCVTNVLDAIGIVSGKKPFISSSKLAFDKIAYGALLKSLAMAEDAIKKNPWSWDNLTGYDSFKRAAEVAAAGGHGLVIAGEPDVARKLARAITDALPDLDTSTAETVGCIRSMAGYSYSSELRGTAFGFGPLNRPCFLETSGDASYSGFHGKSIFNGARQEMCIPGDAALAHGGVLFLPEFQYATEGIRRHIPNTLKKKKVSPAKGVDYPADFIFVTSTTLSPCGTDGGEFDCQPVDAAVFRSKIFSSPIYKAAAVQVLARRDGAMGLERIAALLSPGEQVGQLASCQVKRRIELAWAAQSRRFVGTCYDGKRNQDVRDKDVEALFDFEIGAVALAKKHIKSFGLGLSSSLYPILKIARTIADLDGQESVTVRHISRAVIYRFMEIGSSVPLNRIPNSL